MKIEVIKSNPLTHQLRIGRLSEQLDFIVGDEIMMIDCFKNNILVYRFYGQSNITNLPLEVENQIDRIIFKTLDNKEDGVYNFKN